jgi:hypothetical protein
MAVTTGSELNLNSTSTLLLNSLILPAIKTKGIPQHLVSFRRSTSGGADLKFPQRQAVNKSFNEWRNLAASK